MRRGGEGACLRRDRPRPSRPRRGDPSADSAQWSHRAYPAHHTVGSGRAHGPEIGMYNRLLFMGANSVSGTKGTCYLLFAYDVGWSIDLGAAEKSISAFKERSSIKHKPRAPQYLQFQPPPLRVLQEAPPLSLVA